MGSITFTFYSFLLEAEFTPGPLCGRKDYVNKKIVKTLSWIEPVTFQRLVLCLTQLRHRVHPVYALNHEDLLWKQE